MDVDISPITLDTTKRLAQLYPSPAGFPGAGDPAAATLGNSSGGRARVLDGFFAADFLPARSSRSAAGDTQQRPKPATIPDIAHPLAAAAVAGDGESYGAKYVRFLHDFAWDHARHIGSGVRVDSDEFADECVEEISRELARHRVWEPKTRERLVALVILVQAHFERADQPTDALVARLAADFAKSRLKLALWQCISLHLTRRPAAAGSPGSPGASLPPPPLPPPPPVSPDDLEVAVELLYLFETWALRAPSTRALNELGIERVRLAVELFVRYAHQPLHRRHARHLPQTASAGDVGRLQRLRLGHKALLLLEATWGLLVGDEAAALRRIHGASYEPQPSARELQKTVLARDALRQIFLAVDKHPLLARDVQADVRRLLPLVHPFDGHLTRAAHLGRFGPIRAPEQAQQPALPREMGSPSTQMLLADMVARLGTEPQPEKDEQRQRRDQVPMIPPGTMDNMPAGALLGRNPWAARLPPRAAREAVAEYIGAVRVTRSDREYAEWWRRLVGERGMPLSLTLNSPTDRKGAGNDISINYSDSNGTGSGSRRGVATLYEFCGIVEAEDLPGLEMELDSRGHEVQWPPHTAAEQDADAHNILYRALFPLLPELSKALVLTIVNWAPTERELPMRQFLINVGPPQVSEATCLGIVKYPRLAECPVSQRVSRDHGNGSVAGDSEAAGSTEGSGSAGAQSGLPPPPPPKSPLLGSNVKRLGRPHSRSSGSIEASSSSSGGGGGAPQTDSTLRGSSSMTNATTMGSADGSQLGAPGVPAEVGARLLTQYAQWQAVGRVLMRVMLGLQANHVLQADYFAQLLMNENVIPAMFWWLGTASLDLCTALPSALRTHSFSAAYARARQRRQTRTGPATESASASSAGTTTTARSGASLQQQEEEAPAACELALRGIHDCLRSLRRLTSHNGLRKGLLYKNKAPYFYGRLLRVNSAPVQQIAAELLRDIMPVASKRQKHIMLDTVAQVYLRAPVGLSDTFWLAEYGLDPQIEMHRHVELLRLLHYYHHQAFGLRLPRDPALFPSLVAHAVDALVPRTQKHHASGDTLVSETAGNRGASRTASSHRRRAERKGSCKQSGPAASDHSWLLWESDLEDTLNDVYASPIGAGSSG